MFLEPLLIIQNNSFDLYSAFQGPKDAYRDIADTDNTPIENKDNKRQSTIGKQKQYTYMYERAYLKIRYMHLFMPTLSMSI